MKNKFFIGLAVSILVVLQIWCTFLTFNSPYIGIYLAYNEQQWIIEDLDKDSASTRLDVQIGDIVHQVDGKIPGEFPSVLKWRTIEQAHTLVLLRNGLQHEVAINARSVITYDIVPIVEELVCLFMVVFLIIKIRFSPSARMLAAVFLTMAVIYTSLGASVRGDTIGKVGITSFMMVLPIVFNHFFGNFLQGKRRFKPTIPDFEGCLLDCRGRI